MFAVCLAPACVFMKRRIGFPTRSRISAVRGHNPPKRRLLLRLATSCAEVQKSHPRCSLHLIGGGDPPSASLGLLRMKARTAGGETLRTRRCRGLPGVGAILSASRGWVPSSHPVKASICPIIRTRDAMWSAGEVVAADKWTVP